MQKFLARIDKKSFPVKLTDRVLRAILAYYRETFPLKPKTEKEET